MNDDDFLEDLSNLKRQLSGKDAIERDEIDEFLEGMDESSQTETSLVKCEDGDNSIAVGGEGDEGVSVTVEKNSKEEIQNYVLEKCKKVIFQGMETLEGLQDTVVNTCDGKAINGYATLVAALGKVLDTANSIGMEKSRIDSAVEMENLKHKHKTEIKSSEKPSQHNTLNIIAGREEIMKMLNDEKNGQS